VEQHQARYEGTQGGAVHPALTPRQQEGNWLPFTSAVQETMSSEYNIRKRSEAIAYLKMRGKHLLTTKFMPTDSAHTDVAKTMEEYKKEEKK